MNEKADPGLIGAMVEDVVYEVVREELASMGGDLLKTYGERAKAHLSQGDKAADLFTAEQIQEIVMAALGGFLLERFGA